MEEKSKNQLFCFQINDTEYAFPIDSVNEVLNNFKMTSIPQASDEVEGVINWRGDIIPIINLGTVLNKKNEEAKASSKFKNYMYYFFMLSRSSLVIIFTCSLLKTLINLVRVSLYAAR